MLTATISPLAQTLLPELDHELALTRRVLERVPAAQFGWQPHSKSMTLAQLATHTAELPGGIGTAMYTTEMDLAAFDGVAPTPPATTAALLDMLAESGSRARTALTAAEPEDFDQTWTLRHGQHQIMRHSRAEVVRHLISHMVHHRGQLSVYLRLLDIPVPSIYGPSADEAL
ncbi:Uncharacterized damage-inducible protein DinB (forms a four-helix bundle) [Hymenobacter daecheongensis DSM 21074]|uniref:Uncharacterized damage-inducible protein DinB (Forms a four-helix bundle) n=1 Tax=Hymenobacter daecheongensis DSM 21074 TaxID=1121955 RepID=A0A1M6EX64_9BACT|nr:DinB family protein [Hymenobacter daecheongensis]SHI90006.1 Uncharacterized damage-inducible protein DinB (forms a four-helix bundle) [Hymenobacter daecheongensis DSM 21074]